MEKCMKELFKKIFLCVLSIVVMFMIVIGMKFTNAKADSQDGNIVIVTLPGETNGGDIQITTTKNNNITNGDTTNNVNGDIPSGEETKKTKITKRAKIISIVRSAKKPTKAKLTIKKIKKISGYQIKYSTNKKLKKFKICTSAKNKITLKKLKAKRKYYVKARVYVKSGKQNVYGKWSRKKVV